MQSFIETAISILLLFLLVSIVVTAINEIISRFLRLRGAMLSKGIAAIIDDKDLRARFYASGVIFAVDRDIADAVATKTGNTATVADTPAHPSYIQAENFARALLQAVIRGKRLPISPTLDQIKDAIDDLDDGRIKDVLAASVQEGIDSVAKLEKELAAWYDRAADRISGRYRRWKQTASFVIGLALAVLLNIDALHFVSRVTADADLRAAIVAQAVEIAGQDETLAACAQTAPADGTEPDPNADISGIECYSNSIADTLGDLHALPIGWTDANLTSFVGGVTAIDVHYLLSVILGWLITAFAVTLGAPFWFDLLKTFVNIRSTGTPPKPSS